MTEQNNNPINSPTPNKYTDKVKSKLEEYSKLKFLYNKTGNLLFKRNLTLFLQKRITQSLNHSSNNSSLNLFSIPNIIEHIYGDYIRRHNLNITEEMIKLQKEKELKAQEYSSNTHKVKSRKGYCNQKYITINTENSDTGASLKNNYSIHTSKYSRKHNDKLNTIDNTESKRPFEMYTNIQRRIISNKKQPNIITDSNIDQIEKSEDKISVSNSYNKINMENKGKENENENINYENEIFEFQPIRIEKNYNEMRNKGKNENKVKIKIKEIVDKKEEKEKRKHHHKHHHRHHHYQHFKRERILLPVKIDSFVLLRIDL